MKKIFAYESKDEKVLAKNGLFVAQKELMQELEDWMYALSLVPIPQETNIPLSWFKERIEYVRIVALALRPKFFWKLLKIKRQFDRNLKMMAHEG